MCAESETFGWLWLTENAECPERLIKPSTANFDASMVRPKYPPASWSCSDFDFETDPARANGLRLKRRKPRSLGVPHGRRQYDLLAWLGSLLRHPLPDRRMTREAYWGGAALKENLVLFIFPVLGHCGPLPGPGGISQAHLDPMRPLEAWLSADMTLTSMMAE